MNPGFLSTPYFSLTDYMKPLWEFVNCVDQAGGIITLGRLLGISGITGMKAIPFGYLNKVNLVGIGLCNNPKYEVPPNYVCFVDDLLREHFVFHAFVVYNGKVFDATVGPTLGKNVNQYLVDTIDTSTSEEANASLFDNSGEIKPNTMSVIFNSYGIE